MQCCFEKKFVEIDMSGFRIFKKWLTRNWQFKRREDKQSKFNASFIPSSGS